MALTSTHLLAVAVASIIFIYVKHRLREIQFQRFALAHGCVPPVYNHFNKLPWGLDGLYRLITTVSRGGDILDDLVIPRFRSLKTSTFESTGLLGKRVLDTIDPLNVQAMLATQFKDFATGETRSKQFGALLGRNIFTADGEFWARSRALFRPHFAREMINDLAETERAAGILVDVLPKDPEDEKWTAPVDLMDLFYRFTLDTASSFLFGHTTDSQLAAAGRLGEVQKGSVTDMASDAEFVEAFTVSQEWLSWRIRCQGLYWMVQSPKWWKAVATVRKFVNGFVEMALEKEHEREEKEEKAEDIDGKGEKYNLLQELSRQCRDPIELRDQALGILFAGRDTTASLLGWLFLQLSLHPTIYTHLRDTLPSRNTPLTFTTLKSLTYLQHCLLETLRLYPPVPFNNRQAVRNTTLPRGGGEDGSKPVAVRKGEVVNFPVYAMMRREESWGCDAGEWRPERWVGRKVGWDFVPFSGGPRVCLGQQYALTEAAYLTVRIVQQFDRIEFVGEEKVKKGFILTMFPQNVLVRLHKAAPKA